MIKLTRIGIDLAKDVFQLHGVDHHGKYIFKRRLTRSKWLNVLCNTVEPGCEIAMEACSGAHHWARVLQAHGFVVKLIAPQFVKPYAKSNKNDANDAVSSPLSMYQSLGESGCCSFGYRGSVMQ